MHYNLLIFNNSIHNIQYIMFNRIWNAWIASKELWLKFIKYEEEQAYKGPGTFQTIVVLGPKLKSNVVFIIQFLCWFRIWREIDLKVWPTSPRVGWHSGCIEWISTKNLFKEITLISTFGHKTMIIENVSGPIRAGDAISCKRCPAALSWWTLIAFLWSL